MSGRRTLYLVWVAAFGICLALLIPTSRMTILGAFRREPFFGWHPHRYWEGELAPGTGDSRRKQARDSLQAGGVRALPVIQAMLDGDLRGEAAAACPRIPEAVSALTAAYERESSLSPEPAIVKRSILQTLEEMGPLAKDAVPLLIDALDGPLAHEARRALTEVDPEAARREFIQWDDFAPLDMAFDRQGNVLAVLGLHDGTEPRSIRLWTIGTSNWSELKPGRQNGGSGESVWHRLGPFSENGRQLLVLSSGDELSVVDVSAGSEHALLLAYDRQGQSQRLEGIQELAWDQHGNVLALAADGWLQVDPGWQMEHPNDPVDVKTRLEPIESWPGNVPEVRFRKSQESDSSLSRKENIACSTDGQLGAVSHDLDEQITIWNLSTDQVMTTLEHKAKRFRGVNSVYFCGGDNQLVSAGRESVKIWDLASQKELVSREFDGDSIRLVISPDGMLLAGHPDRGSMIRVWRIRQLVDGGRP